MPSPRTRLTQRFATRLKLRIHCLCLVLVLLVACSSAWEQQAASTTAIVPMQGPQAEPARTIVVPTELPRVEPTATAIPSPTPDPDIRMFTETSHSMRGVFRQFWEREGGVARFGLPLTEELLIDAVLMQYFERARFELRDGGVVLGRLGAELQEESVTPAEPVAGCQFFDVTQHNICEPLLAYWNSSGGMAALGLPIEDARQTTDRTVQYFERARIEVAEGQPPMLARIGAERLASLPGGSLIQSTEWQRATQDAFVVGQAMAVRPLQQAQVGVRADGYNGAAEVIIADRRGVTRRYPVEITNGAAEINVDVIGGLGPQAALVVIDGKLAGVSTSALIIQAETTIKTGQARFDDMFPIVEGFMLQDTSDYVFDGYPVHGYRSPDSDLLWLRDHVHQGKGYAYWERDMTSLLDQFRRFQYPDGSFDDYIANKPWGIVRGRTEVEADLEYLFVEGVYRAWQSTGDDDWLRQQFDAMERGLAYIQTSPLRWDSQYQLVKRPFTVDTWDFEYGLPTLAPDGKLSPRHWIDENTKWCIFHGDNTGYANSMELLARMYEHLGNTERSQHWRSESDGITSRLHALAWNGTFFRHMVHLTPVTVPGVDESKQLSLSNAYALNRKGLRDAQARSIIDEYYQRYVNRGSAFSEWLSIDPPFPAGSLSTSYSMGGHWGQNPGEYVNGGHMPLVGGELARGAFARGSESYGFDILQRYYSLVSTTGESYLWYFPIGQPGRSGADTLPTDGWGSSAMLAALIEGAAGVRDDSRTFERATLAPRWTAAPDVNVADVVVRYGASDGYVAYHWERQINGFTMRWTGSGTETRIRLLLPPQSPDEVVAVLDGQTVAGRIAREGSSRYWEAHVPATGTLGINW
jgi:hypothetical protein